jgi:hypothetical protein
VSENEKDALSKASYDITEKFVQEIETNYEAILKKHGFVSHSSWCPCYVFINAPSYRKSIDADLDMTGKLRP